ncbi:hypothetical protein ACFWHT_04360 [Microbacterium sp. NPDC058342]|uniref:hypothetical protein n=1 Tax=Microbacterium sp. NPDC058342 TaxID=3346454 RepID=UPI00364B5A80
MNAPDKQRGGSYGAAQQMAACLTNRTTVRWIVPELGDTRPTFDPAAFVRAGGTLFSLSREGRGTAGPLVTALTVAVVEAAEELAVHSPGGRLATPPVSVLDEAANACRWQTPSGVADFVCHAETGTVEVSAPFGSAEGFGGSCPGVSATWSSTSTRSPKTIVFGRQVVDWCDAPQPRRFRPWGEKRPAHSWHVRFR